MFITEDHIAGAQILADAAPGIIIAAETELQLRGVDDASETIVALLTAAWEHHKEVCGRENAAPFISLVRDFADIVDRGTRPAN